MPVVGFSSTIYIGLTAPTCIPLQGMLQSWGEQVRLAQHFRKPTSTCCDAPINSSAKTCFFFESQGRTSRRNTGISPLLITDQEIF